ncbi:3-hydroxyacyl-CoA dehydrogenase [Caenimonas sp. SL110]|uniref:3-hydroxyacyl-CoA dehydrogenase n=1 Tax=Caenimonas sp. SL110 TaxID=1450524 RepID=UPI0009E54795|nr:3-hydroxyacyl-CoA dehydrogenase [Caenimonas sp. SL110]
MTEPSHIGQVPDVLEYLAQAQREAVVPPLRLRVAPRAVGTVAIIGAGTMGSGIAIAALTAEFDLILLEQDEAALAKGVARITDHFRGRVAAGKLDATSAGKAIARLSFTTDWAELARADLVIEAVFEDLAVKQQVFRRIDEHARAHAVLATNTSYLDVDAIASATSRPQDVLGLHFFSPAHVMKLLEVVQGKATSADVLATGMAFGVAIGKSPVLTGNAFGFIGNRIYNAYRRQCEFMLEDGAWPEDVDSALTDFGFAMGPFAVADLSGLDIAWRMRKAQAATRDARERYVGILDELCELGRLGRKSAAGYYAYPDGKREQSTDPIVREVIARSSAARGITRRHLTPAEICDRALFAMVNEAALLMAEGVAARPGDIDVVMTQGYGFPRGRGGPVYWARQLSADQISQGLAGLARHVGHGFVSGDIALLLKDRNDS